MSANASMANSIIIDRGAATSPEHAAGSSSGMSDVE
jgi:hypothetical protein